MRNAPAAMEVTVRGPAPAAATRRGAVNDEDPPTVVDLDTSGSVSLTRHAAQFTGQMTLCSSWPAPLPALGYC
jgi:hypothetical protein